uniref:Glucosylceramidase n=3 Tax=Culicoides sonorensis TaxID=179676 RepID=A0A336LVU1_CULSO
MSGFNECRINFLLTVTILVTVINVVVPEAGSPCILRPYPDGLVCVCNSTYCDTLEFSLPTQNGSILIVSTSEQGLRFKQTEGNFNSDEKIIINDFNQNRQKSHRKSRQNQTPNIFDSRSLIKWIMNRYTKTKRQSDTKKQLDEVNIKVDHSIAHQKIVGFGGALTGSVAHLLNEMDSGLKEKILQAYFSKRTGIGYSMIRTSIGGCDFDLKPWAYNEIPKHDSKLTNFTELDERDLLKVGLFNEIKTIAEDDKIKIMAAAWSPPKWMKTNDGWTGPSALRAVYYSTWADYHMKFLELMDKANISVWAISTGNEPMNGAVWWMVVKFMSLGWSPKEQGIWVAQHLGPKLKESKFKDVLLFAGDDQRYTFPWWFDQMQIGDQNSMKFIDGFAVHWYWDTFIPPKSTLDKTSKLFPEKLIINTESCLGDKPWEFHGPELGSWARAIPYITTIIQDLHHSVSGWFDWNLVLNEQGGPNYAHNYVEAPIVKNNTIDEIYKQPIFYVLGHFSKFILPESVRLHSSSSDINVEVLAFIRPDGLTSVILYNS